jgi:hypothetical protein
MFLRTGLWSRIVIVGGVRTLDLLSVRSTRWPASYANSILPPAAFSVQCIHKSNINICCRLLLLALDPLECLKTGKSFQNRNAGSKEIFGRRTREREYSLFRDLWIANGMGFVSTFITFKLFCSILCDLNTMEPRRPPATLVSSVTRFGR